MAQRNAPCHCGSGLRYKHCHGSYRSPIVGVTGQIPLNVSRAFLDKHRKEQVWRERHGAVPPPITAEIAGHRFVFVGNQVARSEKWKTFHDFLFDYIKDKLGADWGQRELSKPYDDRHPILQWYQKVCDFQQRHHKHNGRINEANAEGVVNHYLRLSYDLYCLHYAGLLQDRLIARLKQRDQFQGAMYELYVTASAIRAGFEVVLEDETDGLTSHCEFTMTHQKTGRSFSVEAKSRHRPGVLGTPGKRPDDVAMRVDVERLIQKALRKTAGHARVVFIDVNLPPSDASSGEAWVHEAAELVRSMEAKQMLADPWPSAIVFFTNLPLHYLEDEDKQSGEVWMLGALNRPELADAEGGLWGALERSDSELLGLFRSLASHTHVPHELDYFGEPGLDPTAA